MGTYFGCIQEGGGMSFGVKGYASGKRGIENYVDSVRFLVCQVDACIKHSVHSPSFGLYVFGLLISCPTRGSGITSESARAKNSCVWHHRRSEDDDGTIDCLILATFLLYSLNVTTVLLPSLLTAS